MTYLSKQVQVGRKQRILRLSHVPIVADYPSIYESANRRLVGIGIVETRLSTVVADYANTEHSADGEVENYGTLPWISIHRKATHGDKDTDRDHIHNMYTLVRSRESEN